MPQITTANPGNLVVPLSAIIDRLHGKLSAADLDALLLALVAPIKDLVRPGDLITADLMNAILSDIADLQARLAKLEGTSPTTGAAPVIDRVVPAVQRVGQTLTIFGRNFEAKVEDNIVKLAGFRIERFQPSPPGELVFGVPLFNIVGATLDTEVSVRTGRGEASMPVTLLPELVIPTGFVSFTEDPGNRTLPRIDANSTYDIGFMVNSQTTIAESYVISFSYADAAGGVTADDWRANTSLRTGSGGTITTEPIRLEPFTPFKVVARVKVPGLATPNATTVKFFLSVTSVNNEKELSKTSDPLEIIVGQTLPFNDPRVDWVNEVASEPVPGNDARRVLDATSGKEFVEVPFGGTGLLRLRATFAQDGSFAYAVTMDPASAGEWGPVVPRPATSTDKHKRENELIGVVLRSLAAANPGHSEARTLTVKATRTPPSGAPTTDTETFTSWTKISIRGYTR